MYLPKYSHTNSYDRGKLDVYNFKDINSFELLSVFFTKHTITWLDDTQNTHKYN